MNPRAAPRRGPEPPCTALAVGLRPGLVARLGKAAGSDLRTACARPRGVQRPPFAVRRNAALGDSGRCRAELQAGRTLASLVHWGRG
eukprot:17203-Alexandrium_andersonii.AAC.1